MSLQIGQGVNALQNPLDEQIGAIQDKTFYKQVQDKVAADRQERGIWVKSVDTKGEAEYYLDITRLSSKTFYTSVKTHEDTVRVPLLVKMVLGQKIQIKDRVEALIESYKKAVVQTTSHNLLLSRLAGMKMSSFAYILAMIGVPPEELKKLKKQALEDAIAENLALVEENIYNMELWEILGGGRSSKAKAQKSILEEIQTQLLTQAKRLNIEDYYTREKILELRLKVCKDIVFKFREEEQTMQYELDYYSSMQ